MALFQKSVLQKYLKTVNEKSVNEAWQKFTQYFHNSHIQENIRNSKEEQFQATFLNELFVKILGYTLNPQPNYNLATEFKNIKGAKKADGAILKQGKAIGVIELKGTNTVDLDKVEQQAFGYKNNQPDAAYVITSNFEKLRFYIDNATEHLEFNLFQLSQDQFKVMWLCLAKDNVYSDLPKTIGKESLVKEENITKQLYKDYSNFKQAIYNSIVTLNPKYDKLQLFKKTQKLLDRFLFVFFAEDRGLLPPNSMPRIIDRWKKLEELDNYKPLYEIVQQYFGYFNKGRKGKKAIDDIFAYNGGLFRADKVLDNLKIDDKILLEHTQKLSTYDFESEIDVNILGHIFEHSLNEIEEMTARLEGKTIDKSKTKRKKDGVFYTPKYITKYIVENTVGKLCEEKKQELEMDEADYLKDRKGRKKATLKRLKDKLETYRNWLLELTICDPACGSGAFLNQALAFLIEEHQYIDELQTQLLGGGFVFPNVENTILEKNLFGVDINEESIEIAKLSLWLRTARRGRKLTSLSNNIKCGNSLIDDPEVAGDKAFDWQKEFPKVFKNGGFDVVIGNPPYVRHEIIKDFKPYFQDNFETYLSTADLYVYFIELGIKILKIRGIMGFINPNKFIKASYGKELKQFLSKKQIEQLIDFGELNVFQDAVTSPLILIVRNTNFIFDTKFLQVETLKNLNIRILLANKSIGLKPKVFKEEKWNLISEKELSILNKVVEIGTPISENQNLKIKRGLLTGLNEAFIISQEKKDSIVTQHPKSRELIRKFIDGDDVRKYEVKSKNKYLICIPSGYTDLQGKFSNENEAWLWMKENYSGITSYLEQFTAKAKKRRDKGNYWWELRACDYYDLIDKPKIIYPEIAMSSRFAIDENSTYINKTIFLINSSNYALLSLLNSSLIWFYLMNTCASLGNPKNGGRLNMQKIYLETISIPINIKEYNSKLEQSGKSLQAIYFSASKIINRFLRRLQNNLGLEKTSKKIEAFYEFDFNTLVKELKKKKIQLSLTEQDKWEEYFQAYKTEINELQSQIDQTDKEIDQMVYELYGLTDEEIAIVENSIK